MLAADCCIDAGVTGMVVTCPEAKSSSNQVGLPGWAAAAISLLLAVAAVVWLCSRQYCAPKLLHYCAHKMPQQLHRSRTLNTGGE